METLFIDKTESTPEITFNFSEGILEIKGVSIPEDTDEFYQPILDALNNYVGDLDLEEEEENETDSEQSQSEKSISILFKFIYINTGTSAVIVKMLKKLEEIEGTDFSVQVQWYYEEADEDMKDLGDYFHSFTELPFETIAIEEID